MMTASEKDARIDFPQGAEHKEPTADGRRLEIADLNFEKGESGEGNLFLRSYRRVSQFLAGMYTGVKCGGIPHSHHTYDRDDGPI